MTGYTGKTHLMKTRKIQTGEIVLWCGGSGHVVFTTHHFLSVEPSRRCARCGMLRDHAEAKRKSLEPAHAPNCTHPIIIVDKCRDCGRYVGPQP